MRVYHAPRLIAFVLCSLCDVTKCAVMCGDQGHTKNNLDLRDIHVKKYISYNLFLLYLYPKIKSRDIKFLKFSLLPPAPLHLNRISWLVYKVWPWR
jgi:hypothetical protein